MLRLIYDDEMISVTVDNSADGRYTLISVELFFGNEMLATRERVQRFGLYGFDCGNQPGPECGRLVIDGTEIEGPDDILRIATAHVHNSELDGLLGISPDAEPGFVTSNPITTPISGAPADAPSE
jgi:hypothetical protein